MFFYILLVFIALGLFLLSYFKPSTEKMISVCLLLLMVLISGFRDTIGSDYISYVNWYLYKTRDDGLEFGFVAIMNLFRWLNLSPFFLFFIFSFSTCCLVFLAIKRYTVNCNLSLLFYIMIPSLYLTSFTMIRQSLSVVISFYAFSYLIKKKYILYFFLMFIGVSIHNSCLIAFVIFFLVFKYADKIKNIHLCGLLIVSFLLSRFDFFLVFRELFDGTRYSYYFSEKIKQVDTIKIIIINLEGILFLFYFNKIKEKSPYLHYILVLYCFSIVLVNFFSKNDALTRLASYFRIFEILLLSDLVFSVQKVRRVVLLSVFYLVYFGGFLFALKKDSELPYENSPKFIPYKNILWSSLVPPKVETSHGKMQRLKSTTLVN